MHVIVTIVITAAVCLPAGMYLWYRYGSTLKAKVATELSTFGNKSSGK